MKRLGPLLVWLLVAGMSLAACERLRVDGAAATTAQSGCADPASAAVPSRESAAPATATVAPPQASPTDDERAARGVAQAFVHAVLLGRQGEARALLAPEYAAGAGDLYTALGLRPAPHVEWLIGGSERANDRPGVIVEVPLRAEAAGNCPAQRVTARLHLARVADPQGDAAWRIVAIDTVAR